MDVHRRSLLVSRVYLSAFRPCPLPSMLAVFFSPVLFPNALSLAPHSHHILIVTPAH